MTHFYEVPLVVMVNNLGVYSDRSTGWQSYFGWIGQWFVEVKPIIGLKRSIDSRILTVSPTMTLTQHGYA